MSYTPTTWQTGDTVTAALLNKMEQGIAEGGGGSGVLVAHATVDGEDFEGLTPETPVAFTIDKTFEELMAEDFSVIRLDATMEGQVVGTFWFTVSFWGEGLFYGLYSASSDMLDLLYSLMVCVEHDDGATVAYLMAQPASGGGDEPFVITCTPTSASGGTIDKTDAEILAAYEAGRDIRLLVAATASMKNALYPTVVTENYEDGELVSVNVAANIVNAQNNTMVSVFTQNQSQYFNTGFAMLTYTLTPAT